MDRAEQLRNARTSISVQFMDFMKALSRNRTTVVCFFEGEDEKYYTVRINTIIPDTKWTGINCGGKRKVIELRNKIRTHAIYKNSKAAFFIDNDFGDEEIYNVDDYYITPCYSIENLYCNIDTFKRIISAEFGMSDCCSQNNDFEIATSIFTSRLSEFCRIIKPFNVWLKAHSALEKENKGIKKNLYLNNIKIEDLSLIQLTGVTPTYDFEKISDMFPNSFNVTAEKYKESEEYFTGNDIHKLLRGKQQLEFLRVFLTKLKEERSNNENNIFSKKTMVKLQLSKSNVISELSQYANTPKCLVTYLNSFS
ncbi:MULTISPECIES: DUF4435 domain-containing protein [unclassified Aeromonas]|uniref:DUF4435 domain-containing protein n=1 Tax=unclassified Aeromonas TaxID=257493 RepID=UPI001495D7FE|nr:MULTISPECIES: DUF4435 domain-containing protein [unclassified Aeromonas]